MNLIVWIATTAELAQQPQPERLIGTPTSAARMNRRRFRAALFAAGDGDGRKYAFARAAARESHQQPPPKHLQRSFTAANVDTGRAMRTILAHDADERGRPGGKQPAGLCRRRRREPKPEVAPNNFLISHAPSSKDRRASRHTRFIPSERGWAAGYPAVLFCWVRPSQMSSGACHSPRGAAKLVARVRGVSRKRLRGLTPRLVRRSCRCARPEALGARRGRPEPEHSSRVVRRAETMGETGGGVDPTCVKTLDDPRVVPRGPPAPLTPHLLAAPPTTTPATAAAGGAGRPWDPTTSTAGTQRGTRLLRQAPLLHHGTATARVASER